MDNSSFDFISIILSNFEAANESDATIRLTTLEIAERISQHTGKVIAISDIYDKLNEMHFIQASSSDMEFHWLLKQK